MIQRVYIDTSVIGGCFDPEFEEWSNKLFDDFMAGRRIAVISDITLDELEDAPERVRENFNTIPDKSLEILTSDTESRELAEKYLLENVVTARFFEDALHIAISTLHQVNVVASWNFKHIVNLDKIRQYNSVNLKYGYSMIEIRTPREILKFDDDENG
ncbi:MAG: PIN domain protein [Bacteroidales bacterium]|nr:PIN domain protein [Bacteroidales bacterium]